MTERRTIPAGKRSEILEEASQRETAAEMQRVIGETAQVGETLKSRLLQTVQVGENPHVVMDLPTCVGRAVTVHEGEQVEVTFEWGGQRLGFRGEIKGRCFHQVREGKWVGALMLSYPEELEIRQRRAFYRVGMGGGKRCRVMLGEMDEDQETEVIEGEAEDISVGGIGVCSRETRGQVGTRVRVSLQLPGEKESVALMGEIRNLRSTGEREVLVGVEFMRTQESVEGRRAVGMIGKYVAARQREMLRQKTT